MTGCVEQYIAISIVYLIVSALVVTKACPSTTGKVLLSVIFSVFYGINTAMYVTALK